jgi:surface polysaccharide O-acyltransferase-like enzyme
MHKRVKGDPILYPKNGGTSLPVDLIRTVAIVLVLLLHASIEGIPVSDPMSPQGMQLWWTSDVYRSIALVCVPLFIMLSGALLLQPSKVDEPIGVFFKKRWKRIGIPFLFWGAAYFAWSFFVYEKALNVTSIVQGVFAGPYYHFWYLYILVGLYLLTPVIRVLVAHASWRTMKYFLVVWFVGTAIIPLFSLYTAISTQVSWFNGSVFVVTGLVGYYILGAYAAKLQLRFSRLILLLAAGWFFTIFGTYVLVGALGESFSPYLLDASSFGVIFASTALFLLLAAIPNQTVETRFSRGNKVLKIISLNTLPIYLFHVMVMEALQRGYLGFKLSVTTLNPVIEIPLIVLVTLLICLAVIVPIMKIPYVKRIIG